VYSLGYGIARFILEYFREPDSWLGYIFAWGDPTAPTALFVSPFNFSMGQILSFIMIVGSLIFLFYAKIHFQIKPNEPFFIDAARAAEKPTSAPQKSKGSAKKSTARSSSAYDAANARKIRKKLKNGGGR
jgi:hypothetical protein